MIEYLIVITLILLMILYYYNHTDKTTTKSNGNMPKPNENMIDVRAIEDLRSDKAVDTPKGVMLEGGLTTDILQAEGYAGGDVSWSDYIAADNLDPSTYDSQREFVKDVTRFSSGANFTSVADDNTSPFFTNFVGLRRPQHVPIGASARTLPDIDENVLKRNNDFRW